MIAYTRHLTADLSSYTAREVGRTEERNIGKLLLTHYGAAGPNPDQPPSRCQGINEIASKTNRHGAHEEHYYTSISSEGVLTCFDQAIFE